MGEELLISCDCHGYHYVEFWYDKDFGLSVTFIERPKLILDRLRAAKNALLGKDICNAEVIIKEKDYNKLSKYLKQAIIK